MTRGVYFDAWFPRQHNYHPSLPPRRLRMVDDLVAYRATTLVWSALGGGSISLPWLEQEAWGEIDPRFRMYGFVNDAEFIAAAQARGIDVFGIVFEVQGWEFPVELNVQQNRILAVNELRGEGQRGWLGLREFTQDRYPNLWKSHREYFPDGLRDRQGNLVTDILDHCCSRDIHGQPCHAHWVECPDREHFCFTMDRNNPIWREYLKAIIRIQIDAGVAGIQLDEVELPLTTLQYGGCFCNECMTQFRQWLQALPANQLPADLTGADLTSFHYGEWLLARGYDFKANRESTPLYWVYIRFQRQAITRYFKELADYARDYAASKGRTIKVSGNFFNCLDQYYALEPEVDLVMTEMRNTRYRQPAWYRYVRGFGGERPVIVVENPYGGVVPDLVSALRSGRGYDRFRMSLYEAAALGVNMSVPYGSWMGSVVEDAFYAPHDLCVEIQDFLAGHEALFSHLSLADVAVVYSVESNFHNGARPEEIANNPQNALSTTRPVFWDACETLADARQPYDVVFFPDGTLRPDDPDRLDLSRYRTVVLPACHFLTEPQADALLHYLDGGGRVTAIGTPGENLPTNRRAAIAGHRGTTVIDDVAVSSPPVSPQVTWDHDVDLAVNVVQVERGAAIHLIRYDYDDAADAVPVLVALEFTVRLDGEFDTLTCYTPSGPMSGTLTREGDRYRIALQQVPLYSIVLLTGVST
jgi:hypothetical protein